MMWKPEHFSSSRGSYQEASRVDDDSQSDDQTLAEEDVVDGFHDELPLTPDELCHQNPLDEKNGFAVDGHSHQSRRWTRRLQWWKQQPEAEKEANEVAAALMNDSTQAPRWAPARQETVGWLIWPLPSYTHRFFVEGATGPEEVRRPTDYLDGLRGVASLFVFFGHVVAEISRDLLRYSYGAPYGTEGQWWVVQLPFIRTFYAGSPMVAIFFVISGYVLAQRCVIAMRAGKQDKLYTALTSMTFRRAIRLFLPSVVASLVCLMTIIVGFHRREHPEHWTVFKELGNFWHHLFYDLFKIWDWEVSFNHFYGPQLWTIPLEYRCSMVLFLFILLAARCTVAVRFVIESITLVYLFYAGRWDIALFIAGMALAEINIIVDERNKIYDQMEAPEADPAADIESHAKRQRWFNPVHVPLWCTLLFGYYLTGYPMYSADVTPGYIWFAAILDDFRFWLAIAAILVVGPISFLPRAQALFTTPVARYLGKISYALYLVHVMVIETVGRHLWYITRDVIGYHKGSSDLKFWTGWGIVCLFTFPIIMWFADVFWRAVDVPTVKFAKWVEEKCFVKLSKAS